MYVFFGFCAAVTIAQTGESNSLAWAALAFVVGCMTQIFAKD